MTDLNQAFSLLWLDEQQPYLWSYEGDDAVSQFYGFLQAYMNGEFWPHRNQDPVQETQSREIHDSDNYQPVFQKRRAYTPPEISESSGSMVADIQDLQQFLEPDEYEQAVIFQMVHCVMAQTE